MVTSSYSGPAYSPVSTEPSTTVVITRIDTHTYPMVLTITADLETPKCRLPSRYPRCQAEWDAYISVDGFNNNIPYPLCSQAIINSGQCDSLISQHYESEVVFGHTGIPGWVTSVTSTWWPTHRTFAPGCSLGCQTCAIADSVYNQLPYCQLQLRGWETAGFDPEKFSSRNGP